MKEYLLSTNEFLEPKVLEGADAYGTLLTRLLLLQPGTNPLHPAMGVGLGPKYRFISETDLADLETRVKDQIHTYMPSEFIAVTSVHLEIKKSKYLQVVIIADDTKYVFDTEDSNTPIELSDLVS